MCKRSKLRVDIDAVHRDRHPVAGRHDRRDVLAALGFRADRAGRHPAARGVRAARQQSRAHRGQRSPHPPIRSAGHPAGRPAVHRGGQGLHPRRPPGTATAANRPADRDGMAAGPARLSAARADGHPGHRGLHRPGALARITAGPIRCDDHRVAVDLPGLPGPLFHPGARPGPDDQHHRPGVGRLSAGDRDLRCRHGDPRTTNATPDPHAFAATSPSRTCPSPTTPTSPCCTTSPSPSTPGRWWASSGPPAAANQPC